MAERKGKKQKLNETINQDEESQSQSEALNRSTDLFMIQAAMEDNQGNDEISETERFEIDGTTDSVQTFKVELDIKQDDIVAVSKNKSKVGVVGSAKPLKSTIKLRIQKLINSLDTL